MRLMHILDFFNVFGAVLKKFPSIEGLVFKAVLNNNTIGNHQNKPSEIVGRNNVCSLGDFCRNKLLEFIIAMNQLSSDFLVAEQCRVKEVKPEPGIGYISLDYIIYKTVRRGILFLVFRPLYQLVPLARKIAVGNGKKYFVFAFIIVILAFSAIFARVTSEKEFTFKSSSAVSSMISFIFSGL